MNIISKMNRFSKKICVSIVLAMLFTILPINNHNIYAATKIGSSSAYWEVSNKVLTISGSGAIPQHTGYYDYPWYYKDYDTIVIGDEITSIPSGAFFWRSSGTVIKKITIGANVSTIAQNSFAYDKIMTLEFKGTVQGGTTTKGGGIHASAFNASNASNVTNLILPSGWDLGNSGSYTKWGLKFNYVHTHNWTYSVSENKITATCSSHSAYITISASDATYNGSAYTGVVGGEWSADYGLITPTIQYEGVSPTSYALTTTAPSGVGTYKAIITVDQFSISSEFAITKATINPTLSMDDWTYGDVASSPSISQYSGDAIPTYSYKEKDASDDSYVSNKPTQAGEYTIRAVIPDTSNYNGATLTKDFTIMQRQVTLAWSNTIFDYDGVAHKPTVQLSNVVSTDSLNVIVSGERTDAGTYTATASLSGSTNSNYVLPSENSTQSFTIEPKSVGELAYPAFNGFTFNSETDTYITDWTTGQTISPVVVVNDVIDSTTKTLVKDVDYELFGNLEASDLGFYTITVEGKGNYTGTTTLEWEIRGQSFTEDDITVTPFYGVYDGNNHSISIVSSLLDVTIEYSETENENDFSTINPAYKDAGNYQVYYRVVKDGFYTHTGHSVVAIEEKLVNVTWDNDTISFVYDGAEHKPTAIVNNAVTGDNVSIQVIGGEIIAGTYTATANALTGNDAHNYRLPTVEPETQFVINKVKVNVPSIRQEAFTYNGNEQTCLDINSAYTILDNSRTDAGEQTVTAILKDKINYEWFKQGETLSDYEKEADKEYTFTIKKALVTIPSIRQEAFTYNGNEQTCLDINSAYTILDNSRTDAGEQTVTAILNDKNNFEWNDSTAVSPEQKVADKTYTFRINKATVKVPEADTNQFTYNREEQTYIIATNSVYTISDNKRTDAGSQTVTVSLNDSNNYEWTNAQNLSDTNTLSEIEKVSNKTFTFTINPWDISSVATITSDFPVYEFTGIDKTVHVEVTDGEVILESGRDYSVSGNTGLEPNDYILTVAFDGNYTGSKTLQWKIVEKLEHTGEVQLDPSNGPYTGEVKLVVAGDEEVPNIEFEHPEHLLDQNDYDLLKSDNPGYGSTKVVIEIILSLNVNSEADMNPLSLEAIREVAGNQTGEHFYDISLRKVIKYMDNDEVKHIEVISVTESDDEIELTIHEPQEIPELKSGYSRKYSIIRSHWDENSGAFIAESLDIDITKATTDSPTTFTFKTNKFSDYVLAYKDIHTYIPPKTGIE